ncbi:hypothetical protein ACN9M1_15970 [Ralstonia sp. R-29]|uniref:hypothetical protein n=1 Tax=Ralstonia sp. R-29 TaxID=3404059 RepID=UPI003CE8E25D
MPNPPNPPVAPEPPLPTFAFPFRTKDGKALVDEHIFYQWLADENTGNFAVSSSGMWHGGIHVSADGAGRHLDLVHGVRCIAAGEIIAYRINRAPLISEIAAGDDQPGTTLTGHYSSAFTLVRHTLEYPAGNRLAFFSLYMHLQSVAEYEQKSMQPPAYWARAYEVTEHASDKPKASANTPIPDEHIGLNIHTEPGSPTMLGILPRGAQVRIGETRKKGLWGKIEAIESGTILPPQVASLVPEGADKGWVFLGKEYGHQLLKPIISQAQSGEVIVAATPIRINANDLIGHLGQYWLQAHPEQEHRMVHIEVFCGSDLPDFLAKTRAAAKDVIDLSKRPLLHIDKGVKLFQVKKADAQGHPVYEEGADAPQTAVVQIYSQAALDAFPAEHKGPKDNGPGPGQPWWYVTSANSRHEDISGWVRNRQMPPNGGVMRQSPHAWINFETVIGDDGGNPTICRTVDGHLDYALDEDKPATGNINNLKPLACNFYRALSPMRNEARAADELRALKANKWLQFRASRLMPKHRSEWASQREYESFFETVLKRIDEEPYHDAEIERLKKLVWWDEVSAKVGQPFPNSPEVFHIHPIALAGNFQNSGSTHVCECGCCLENKFKVTRWNGQVVHYGPLYRGALSLKNSPAMQRFLDSGQMTDREHRILSAMSQNEGNIDDVQAYDSEIFTAGACQKTVSPTGSGEFPIQVAQFRAGNEEAYQRLFAQCGWTVETDGSTKMYYQDPEITSGEKITGSQLHAKLREGCNAATFGQSVRQKPLAVIANAIVDNAFQEKQVKDFVVRLRLVRTLIPVGYTHSIAEYFLSDLGHATALDQHVNRPNNVVRDVGKALDNFFHTHPSVPRNPSLWGASHAAYESEILAFYGENRSMNDRHPRFAHLRNQLS